MAGSADIPFLPGNTLKLLNNGDRFYPAMLQDIDQAERSITVEAYIYWAGEIGITFAKALAAAAQRGIKVKLLLDAVGSQSIGNEIVKILEDGGCHLAWYNPIRITRLRRINNRTHRKSLIIDGRVGYTGGAGIADHWTGDAQDDEHWRDMQIRIEGPAVRPLQSGFAHNWLECTGELVTGPDFYPTLTEVGPLAAPDHHELSGDRRVVGPRDVLSSPFPRRSKTIDIANPYFVPDHVSIDLFRDAVKRGVRVRVMVAGSSNDTHVTRLNSLRLIRRVAEGRRPGVRVQPDDDASQGHGRGRPVVDRWHHQLRQPIVLAQ